MVLINKDKDKDREGQNENNHMNICLGMPLYVFLTPFSITLVFSLS